MSLQAIIKTNKGEINLNLFSDVAPVTVLNFITLAKTGYYNPKSKGRTEQIVEAREIMLKHKLPTTPVALLRHIGRKEENYTLTTLEDFLNHDIDMFTIVLVGNSNTYVKDGKMITPRGYEKKSNWGK